MSEKIQCPECLGEGEIDTIEGGLIPCPLCEGTGKIDDEEDFTGEE